MSSVSQKYNSLLASAGDDGIVKCWNIQEPGVPLFQVSSHRNTPVSSVAWNHTCQVVATGGHDGFIALHHDRRLLHKLPQENPSQRVEMPRLNAIAFSSASRYLVSGGLSRTVELWDLKKRDAAKSGPIKVFRDHTAEISCVEVAPRDDAVASGSVSGEVMVHSLVTGSMSCRLQPARTQAIKGLSYSKLRPSVLATAGDDSAVHVWNINTQSILHSFSAHKAPATSVCFAPTHQSLLASTGLDKKAMFYDYNVKNVVKHISTSSPLTCMDFDSTGVTLAIGTMSGQILIYDLKKSREPLQVLSHSPHPVPVNSVKFAKYSSRSRSTSSSSRATPEPRASGRARHESNASELSMASSVDLISPVQRRAESKADLFQSPPNAHAHSSSRFSTGSDLDIDQDDFLQQIHSAPPAAAATPSPARSAAPASRTPMQTPPAAKASRELVIVSPPQYQQQQQQTPPAPTTQQPRFRSPSPPVTQQQQQQQQHQGAAPSSLQANVLRSIIEESMTGFQDSVRHDITNLHLELLRQFHIQQVEIKHMLSSFAQDYRSLLEEVKTLRDDHKMIRESAYLDDDVEPVMSVEAKRNNYMS